MGCASVLAVGDLVWVILGWKWSLVPQPSVRHSHNFKSIKSPVHKQHLDCQKARRANTKANANAELPLRGGRLQIFTTLTEQWKSNEQHKEEGKRQEKKVPKEKCDRKTGRGPLSKKRLAGWSSRWHWPTVTQHSRRNCAKCATYLLKAKNTWHG